MKKITTSIVSSASVVWMAACAAMAAHASGGGLNVTDGLRFHVDANVGVTVGEGNRVTRWADQSGNGCDVVQSTAARQPIARTGAYGAAVYFNASNWMGSVSSGICYANHTILAVVQPDVNYSAAHGIGDLMGSNAGGGYGAGDVLLMCNWDGGRLFRAAVMGNGSKNHYVRATKGNTTELVLVEQRFDGTKLVARVNGSYYSDGDGQNTTDFSDFPQDVYTGVLLGGRNSQIGNLFHGDIYEVLVYDRAITPSERRSLVRHLAGKWGIPERATGAEPVVTDGLRFRMDAREAGLFSTNAQGKVLLYADTMGDCSMTLSQCGTDGSRPSLVSSDGLPALRFDKTNYIASAVSPISYDNHHIFLVIKPATTGQIGDLFLSNASGSYGNGDALLLCNWDSDSAFRAAVWSSDANHYVKAGLSKTDERIIVEQTFDGSTLAARVNGWYGKAITGVPSFSKKGGVNLGGRPDFSGRQLLFNGLIYEVRVYDRVLSGPERRDVILEMSDGWNVLDDSITALRIGAANFAKLPVTDGLAFWGDASVDVSIIRDGEGRVSSWYDISPLNNFVKQATAACRPTYMPKGFFDGRPGVSFDGSQSLYGGDVCYSNHTIFVVAQPAALNCGEDLFASYNTTMSVVSGGVIMLANKNSHTMRGLYAYTGSSYISTSDASFGAARTTPTIYEQRCTDSTLEASALSRKMAKETASVAHTANPVPARTLVSLGGRANSASKTSNFNGVYAEVLIYERALSDAEVSTVEAYLTKKWFDKPRGMNISLR